MDYSLTLYFYPSPTGVNWKSPRHLTWSILKNAITRKPRLIGHVSVLLEGPGKRIFSGMSTEGHDQNRKFVLKEHMGMGVLFHEYEGLVEDEEKLAPELKIRLENGHFSFIKFKLSPESFQKCVQYFEEYIQHNVGKIYGLPYRPRYKEGAGCSAYAASFLEVAGVMNEEFRTHWSGRVRVPQEFIGGPSNGGHKVPVWKILLPTKKSKTWAQKHEDGTDVFFWDPDMMHEWTVKKWTVLQAHSKNTIYQAVKDHNAKGILVDSSKILPSEEPIWLK
jgi:hypothetical protein